MEPPLLSKKPVADGAGFGIRVAARLVDAALSFIYGLIGSFLGGVALAMFRAAGMLRPGWQARLHGHLFSRLLFGVAGMFLYHTLTEGVHGASLGKLACRLRVVTAGGYPCDLGQAMRRSLAYYWDALVFGLVALHSMERSALNQRYGDVWAKTVVVRTNHLPRTADQSAWRFVAGFSLGSACWILSIILMILWKGL